MKEKFIKIRSKKDIAITSIIIATGLILTIMPSSSAITMLGFFIAISGIILAFVLKSAYMNIETKEIFVKKERYFSANMKETVTAALLSPEKKLDTVEDQGNSLKLDIYYNKQKIYAQLNEYIPYKYEPCSKIYEYQYTKACSLIGRP